ncbi:MAG: TonB box-like protein [Moraxellaceae bacterium]|nr:MAG: TonB box-like protein [Moraxellaceae bacterium]
MQQTDLPLPGLYQHYKGNQYLVLATAQHTETEEYLVFYKALDGGMGFWVRPLAMFMEKVQKEEVWVQRFQLIEAKEPTF